MEILTVAQQKKRQPIKEISFRFSSVLIVAIIAVTFTVTSTYVQYAKPFLSVLPVARRGIEPLFPP